MYARYAVLAVATLFAAEARASDTLSRLPPVDAAPTAPVAPAAVTVAGYDAWSAPPDEPAAYEVGAQFNRGVFIRATDLQRNPYALYVGGRLQLRYAGFSRNDTTWTDNAGVVRPIRNRNQFDTERVRLNISGTALLPELSYNFIYDADGDGGSLVDGLAYYFQYEANPALRVRLGRWKVAAHRQWLLSSRYFRFSDRSLATEFFRVGFSDGVWLLGDFNVFQPSDRPHWHYEASLTNGLRTSNRAAPLLDDNLGVAATLYCDPLGPYGAGNADYAWNERPVMRIGGSFAFDKSDDRSDAGAAFALGDDSFLRLTDGTRLADIGSLAPGVTLLGDRVLLAAFDIGVKYRGWSASIEYFVRSIQDLTADGSLPVNKLYAYGYHAELGRFLIEKRLDANLRVSQISGLLGDSFEYAAGINYYWGNGRNDRVNKLTFDAARIVQSAVNSSVIDVFAGDDGLLFRTQLQIGF